MIPVALAMSYYELAGATWRTSIAPSPAGYILLGQQLEQDHGVCPDITRVDRDGNGQCRLGSITVVPQRDVKRSGRRQRGSWPPVPWACAATQLAEAERLVGEQK